MKKTDKKPMLLLLGAALCIILCCLVAAGAKVSTKTEYYGMQLDATQRLESYFDCIKQYKQQLGIAMQEEDIHQTGMIGERFTGITTTVGDIGAKRTVASPDMGALCVRMLYEAGVRPGDSVGAGFSGSFPGMNLAVVAACESMNVNLICIPSVGASTYGATNPEFTFPEMMLHLKNEGLISTECAAVSLGGEDDIGLNMMDQDLVGEIRARLLEEGLPLFEEGDFQSNLAFRENIYDEGGPISCFVAVGGNITSMGREESGLSLGQGIIDPASVTVLDNNSGLVQRYLSRGVAAINLLNIKKIVAEYGLAFDPEQWPERGTSAVYYTYDYPKLPLFAGLCGAAAFLTTYCLARRKRGTDTKIDGPSDNGTK